MASGGDMSNSLDKLGSSLINAVLGGLILWVGQTTVRHAGELAGIEEKVAAVNQEFANVDKRQEGMRKWLESVVNDMKDNNRLQFTLKDGDKLVAQLRHAEQFATELERRMVERIAMLETKLASLEVQHRGSQEVTALQMQVTQLRGELAHTAAIAQEVQYQTDARVARGAPVFLPPVNNPR
jgi:uncharacterized coiled-coil DUF342 family protein